MDSYTKVRVSILSNSFSPPPQVLDHEKFYSSAWPFCLRHYRCRSFHVSRHVGQCVDEFNTCTRVPPSNSPVTTVTSGDIRCNVGGSKGVTGICAAPAGGNMTVEMHAQPGDRSFSNQAIEGNHFGPVIVYMSKVTDATTDPGSGSWLKADEEGYNSTTKKWGTDTLNSNCGHRSFTIPASISPGAYLV